MFTRQENEQWLKAHKRELTDPEFYFGVDNNQDTVEDFEDPNKLKILVVFLGAGRVRVVSSSYNALNWLSHEGLGDKVFVDCCYYPFESDVDKVKGNIPFMMGNISHAPISDYDAVFISSSIFPEILNLPHTLKNSNVGITVEQRDKQDIPLIFYGGASASETSILYGPVYDKDKNCIGKALFDVGLFGYGEKNVPELVKTLYKYKQDMNLHDRVAVRERLISEGVLHDYLFFPNKYEWVYGDDNYTIKEIKKLDERLPDRVVYNTIHDKKFRGFPLKTFSLTNEAADSHDIMISSGCSGQSSCCSFDRPDYIRVPIKGYGLVQLKELVGGTYWTDKYLNSDQKQKVESVKSVRTTNLVKLYLSDGSVVDTTAEHHTVRINYDTCDSEVVQVKELKPGDDMQIKLGTDCFGTYQSVDNQVINEEFAELLGFIQGDGSVTDRTKNQVFMFCKGAEDSYYGNLFKKYLDSSVKKKLQHTCKDGTPIYRYYSNDEDVYNLLISIGVTDGKVNRVPDVIFKSPKTVIQSYLRGIFQADGWSTSTQVEDIKRGSIGLTSVSFDYLQDIQLLLKMVGIYSQVSYRTIDYRSDGCNRQKAHYIHIRTEWANKFKEDVGFLDKNNESFGYKNWRNIPSKMLRQLIKSERYKLPQDKLRTIDDQLSFGSLSLQSLQIIYNSGIKLPRIYTAIAEGNYYPVKVVKVEYTDTPVNTCSTLVTPNHKMCYGMLYESNCMEGTVAGRYEERELEDIEKDMDYVRKTSAPNTISFFCIAGDSKILTDSGYKNIRDVTKDDLVLTTKGFSHHNGVVSTGTKKVLKLTTSRGYTIRVSPEHQIRQLISSFDFESYKPKMSTYKNSEYLNYSAGCDLARGIRIYNDTKNEELKKMNDLLIYKMMNENTVQNRRAFVSGYVQSSGDLVAIEPLVNKVVGENIPLNLTWSEAGNLKIGDTLPIYTEYDESNIERDLDYYIAGRWYGDGSTPNKYNLVLQFSPFEKEVAESIYNQLNRRGDYCTSISYKEDRIYIIFSSEYSSIIKTIISNKDCDLLDCIGNKSLQQKASFVAGLWDSDGTVSGGKCRFVSIRESFIKDLQLVLLSLGIYSRFDRTKQNGFDTKNEYIYGLIVNGKRSQSFFERLPMMQKNYKWSSSHLGRDRDVYPVKIKDLKSIVGSKYRQVYSNGYLTSHLLEEVSDTNVIVKSYYEETGLKNYHFDKIVSIEEEYTDTYDLIRTDSADYIANGIVVGNSYNVNYYKHFLDLLSLGSDYFSNLSLHNERLDIIAYSPEQLALAKKLGLRRMSTAVEGFGERIRDHILNKNLPRKTLIRGFDVLAELGLMNIKTGWIRTGQETDEDFADMLSEFDEIIEHRNRIGSKAAYQANVTPLVIYDQIALRYLPRITAEESYNNTKSMQHIIPEFKKRGIRIKFNGRGCGTWMEQLMLDFGPVGTDWLVHSCLDDGLRYMRMFNNEVKEIATKQLAARGYDPLFFTFERPNDWIFPNDIVKVASDRIYNMWRESHTKNDYARPLCLKTSAQPNPHCYGCQACRTPEEIRDMVHRDVSSKLTMDEVLDKLSSSRYVDTVRIVLQQKDDWDIYDRTPLSHYIAAKFNALDDGINNNFLAVGNNTCFFTGAKGQKGWFSGKWAFDIKLRGRVSRKFIQYIDKVNSQLKSCQIINVIPDTKELPLKGVDNVSYLIVTDKYSLSTLTDKVSNFDWNVKVATKSMGTGLETEVKYMPELKDNFLIVSKGKQVYIYMTLQARYSPYLALSSIIGKGFERMLSDFRIAVIDQSTEVDATCKCGKHLNISLFNNKQSRLCPTCRGKLLLAKLTGKL